MDIRAPDGAIKISEQLLTGKKTVADKVKERKDSGLIKNI